MTRAAAPGTMAGMKLRATTPAPWEVDVESTVRDHLYGERAEARAAPIRRGMPTVLCGRYRLLERLGSGGAADVYRAHDERLRRDVAVKLIIESLARDSAAVRRFRREAELGARLAHPNIAAVLDAGSRPRDYMVMELVDARDAGTLLEQDHALTSRHAVEVVVQICDALEHAHGRGVIHGDVTPRNILVGVRDGAAKLVDFGLAVDRFGVWRPGEIMGTPGYVAPEIARGGGPSPQSDVYSLAVVAYRLLGGPPALRPRSGLDTAARPSAIASLRPLAEVRPDLRPELTAIVGSAIGRDPRARPGSAAEFRDRLLEARTGPAELRAA